MSEKVTPLYDEHISAGAFMVSFAGYKMPLYYTSIVEEHLAVRNFAGVFDVSHMGRIMVTGRDAAKLLNYLTPASIFQLPPRKAAYSFFLTPQGTVIDDLIIYKISDDVFLLIVNAARHYTDIDWLIKNSSGLSLEIRDITEETFLIALQGKEAINLASSLFGNDVIQLKYYRFSFFSCSTRKWSELTEFLYWQNELLISRTGYTGSPGIEIMGPKEMASTIWNEILKLDSRIKKAGLGARDSLRLEAGFPLYGNELSEKITPLNASLARFIDFNKDFLGKDALLKLMNNRIDYKLGGIITPDKRYIPRQNAPLFTKDGEKAGYVSSGGYSPVLEKGIALAFIKTEFYSHPELLLEIRKEKIPVQRTSPPFINLR